MMTHVRLMTMLGATALAAGACAPSAPPDAELTLQRDLAAAGTHAVAGERSARTQFVSPLELGRAPQAAPRTAAPRTAPARATSSAAAACPVTRAAPRTPVAPVARVSRRPAVVDEVPAVAADRPLDDTGPVVEPMPAPEPVRDEPVVAAPSRPADPPPPPPRRGGWTMEDVIRNAPFPINP